MRGADVARVAWSHPTAAVGRASVRALCATAGCAGTPSMMIARWMDHRTRGQSQAASPNFEAYRFAEREKSQKFSHFAALQNPSQSFSTASETGHLHQISNSISRVSRCEVLVPTDSG
jgi:hypothetical protein